MIPIHKPFRKGGGRGEGNPNPQKDVSAQRSNCYELYDYVKLGCPRIVRMSFELPYLDWCRFENSELFQNLKSYLEGLQKQEIQIPRQQKQ